MTSRNNLVNRSRAFLIAAFTVLTLVASAESALAGTWCVPDATIRSMCHHVSPTIQGAIDGVRQGDVIYVAPATPPSGSPSRSR
jgi:hypothetical protein